MSNPAIDTLKQALRPLAPYLRKPTPGPSWQRSFSLIKRRGFAPNTVFDIGVAYGTHELYRAFPHAFYYLIDPTRESLPYMQKIAQHLDCQILNIALGDREDEIEMEIRSDLLGSTFFEDYGPRDVLRRDKVPMRRFDQVIGPFETPALCKIDVQGAEMMVIAGMEGRMQDIDMFLIEASAIATLKDGPEVYNVVELMRRHGFVLFDVLGLVRRPLDWALAQLDLLFVREDSFLRSDRRWAEKA